MRTEIQCPSCGHRFAEQPQQAEFVKEPALMVLEYLNLKAQRGFQPNSASLKFIRARLSEADVTFSGVCRMIDRQVKLWHGTQMQEYLRPATLFNATKFQSYYEARDRDLPPQQNGKVSAFTLKTKRDAIEEQMRRLKNKYTTETATGIQWGNQAMREQFVFLGKELVTVKEQMRNLET